MVILRGKQGYTYESIRDKNTRYSDKIIMVSGHSGSGKTILGEKIVETLVEYGYTGISLSDAVDETESGFMGLKAKIGWHVRELEKQGEQPKALPIIIHAPLSVRGIREKIKLSKLDGLKGKLPKTEFFTLDIKSLDRNSVEYLCETTETRGNISLFLSCIEALKNNEGMESLIRLIDSKSRTKRRKYYDKGLSSEDAVGDKKDAREIKNHLSLVFGRDHILQPSNFKYNLDIKKILRDNSHFHVFTYRYLESKKRLRHFMVYHILSAIEKYKDFATHPIVLLIDEVRSLAPYKAQGADRIVSAKLSDMLDMIRKSKKGFTVVLCTTRYTKTDFNVRDVCALKYMFLPSLDDVDKMKKIVGWSKQIGDKMLRLNPGEFVRLGFENTKLKTKLPKFGHKIKDGHVSLDFNEEYSKAFPDQMIDYTELANEVDEFIKNKQKEVHLKKKEEDDEAKLEIRKEIKKEAKKSKNTDKLKEFENEEKNKRVENKEERNKMILETYERLKLSNTKPSQRNIEKELKANGIKVSRSTVANVLNEVKKN